MNDADEDRFNRVVYVDLPIPPDFHLRERRRPADAPQPARKRNPAPVPRRCGQCGVEFIGRSRAGGFKRANGKVYPRRFCSRACFGLSLVGRRRPGTGGYQGGTQA